MDNNIVGVLLCINTRKETEWQFHQKNSFLAFPLCVLISYSQSGRVQKDEQFVVMLLPKTNITYKRKENGQRNLVAFMMD